MSIYIYLINYHVETSNLFSNIALYFTFTSEQMLSYFLLLMSFAPVRADTNTGNCKDLLQGYLTGQLSSALGAYRREFKSFTGVIEKSIKELKENVKKDINSKGYYVRHIS